MPDGRTLTIDGEQVTFSITGGAVASDIATESPSRELVAKTGDEQRTLEEAPYPRTLDDYSDEELERLYLAAGDWS